MEGVLLHLKHPHTSDKHWSSWSAWHMVEALSSVALQHSASLIKGANFFSISMDEATTVDNVACCAFTATWSSTGSESPCS